MKKHIVLFIGALHGGGGKRLMANLANALSPRSYHKTLLSVSYNGPVRSWIGQTCKHVSLLRSDGEDRQPRYLSAIKSLFRVSDQIRALDADVVITDGPIPLFLMWYVKTFTKQKLTWVARKGTGISERGGDTTAAIKQFVIIAFLRLMYSAADHVVVPSQSVKTAIAKKLFVPTQKTAVIANPVDIEETKRRAAEQLTVNYSVHAEHARLQIVVVNRLIRRKRTDLVIAAFSQIADQWPDARLLIVGDGPERFKLERMASARPQQIRFLGHLDNPLPAIAASSALVLASENEGFGYVIVEAMICGVVPIAFDLDHGPSEIIDDEVNGLLLPAANPVEVLQCAMRRIFNEDATLERIRRGAVESARRYRANAIVAEYHRLICDLLSTPLHETR